MADDDADAREEVHEDEAAPEPRAERRGRGRAASSGSPSACSSSRTASPSSTSPREQWHDVAAFLRDEQQFTQCVDVTAVDHLVAPALRDPGRRRAGALRGGRQLPVALAQPPHPRDRAGPGRRPDGRVDHRPLPGRQLRRARDLRPLRRRVRRATPTSPASSCPTTGSATRCARTTRPRASRSRSRATRARR